MERPATTLKLPRSLWLWFSALFPPLSATAKGAPEPGAGRQMSTPASLNQVRNGDSAANGGCAMTGKGEGRKQKSIVSARPPLGLTNSAGLPAGGVSANRSQM